ncbi:sugar nucleotide-binding protein [Microbacteriaceae bacterium 4G12]
MQTTPPAEPELQRHILLAGCGKLGILLGERLVARGATVFALRRNTAPLPAAFTALAADLSHPLATPLPDVDELVVTLTPGYSASAGHPDDYLVKIRNLAAALPVRPRRVIFVSSTRVFEGRTDGRVITEDDDPAPVTERGRLILDGELLAAELLDAHIVRPAGIYGPGREMLLRTVIDGTPVDYTRRTNRIHQADLARALDVMLREPEPPRLIHAVDQAPAPLGDVVTYIAHRLGRQPPPRTEPGDPAGTVLDGARLLELLGTLEYPTFEAGYAEMTEAGGERG